MIGAGEMAHPLKARLTTKNFHRAGPGLIPMLRRQRQVDFSEFQASLIYTASSRPDKVTF